MQKLFYTFILLTLVALSTSAQKIETSTTFQEVSLDSVEAFDSLSIQDSIDTIFAITDDSLSVLFDSTKSIIDSTEFLNDSTATDSLKKIEISENDTIIKIFEDDNNFPLLDETDKKDTEVDNQTSVEKEQTKETKDTEGLTIPNRNRVANKHPKKTTPYATPKKNNNVANNITPKKEKQSEIKEKEEIPTSKPKIEKTEAKDTVAKDTTTKDSTEEITENNVIHDDEEPHTIVKKSFFEEQDEYMVVCIILALIIIALIILFVQMEKKHSESEDELRAFIMNQKNFTKQIENIENISSSQAKLNKRLSELEISASTSNKIPSSNNSEEITALLKAQEAANKKIQELETALKEQQQNSKRLEEIENSLKNHEDTSKRLRDIENNMKTQEFDQSKLQKNPTQFINDFKVYYPNFATEMKSRSELITDHDIMLAILIVTKQPKDVMLKVFNILPDSLKSARYRIRTKLKLGRDEKLDDFLESLMKH